MQTLRFCQTLCLWLISISMTRQDLCTYCKCVHGQYPDEPIWIDVSKRTEIAVLGHSCGRQVTYTWKAVGGSGEILVDLGTTEVPRVNWLPFAYSVRPDQQGKSNRIIVTKSDGRTTGQCVCHIDFVNLEVYSHIDGARIISIGSDQTVELDGSSSRDYSQPKDRQKYTFEWRCVPVENDMENTYCKEGNIMSTSAKVSIDGRQLAVTGLYKVMLRTKSPITGNTAGDHIYIRVEFGTKIPLLIMCYRNCLDYYYNEGESIFLHVDCIGGCGKKRTFYFEIDDKFVTSNHDGFLRFKAPMAVTFKFNVTLIADGIDSVAIAPFYRNEPPAGGSCAVTPEKGVPGDTLFEVSCRNWTDENLPIYYVLKAGNLLYDRTTDPNWEVYVPQVTAMSLRICDNRDACSNAEVPLELEAVVIPKGLENVKAYMENYTNNVEKLLEGGQYARAVVKAALMMKDQPLDVIKYVLNGFQNFNANSVPDVRQLSTMTSQLIEPMGNLTSEKLDVINGLLDKISRGFGEIIGSDAVREMYKVDVKDLSEEIVGIVSKLVSATERFVDVQSLLWEFEGGMVYVADARANVSPKFGQLIEFYGTHERLNDTILTPINKWLYAICRSFDLLHDIGLASSLIVHKGDEEFIVDKLSIQMTTSGIIDNAPLTLVSADYLTTAFLSKPLLQEMQKQLKGREMKMQVVSFRENPCWWYPTEHPITTAVFSLSVFSEKDSNLLISEITAPLKLEMLQQRWPKEPPLIRGQVYAVDEMPIYQVRAPEGAALIVNFTSVDEDMDVIVQCGKLPNEKEVRESGERVMSGAVKGVTRYAAVNSGGKVDWCYVALIAARHVILTTEAHYAFTIEIQECLSWNLNLVRPTWHNKGCITSVDVAGADNISCLCYHMSIFSGRSYYSTAEEVVRERTLKHSLDINWYLIAFYILLFLIFLWLLLRTCDDLSKSHQRLYTELNENERNDISRIALHITTGGQWTAASSANILITLPAGQTYTITQNPERPFLKPHTTCVLELPIRASELDGPLLISQDKNGRYPSWYCDSITVVNLANGEKRHCSVRKWIGRTPVSVLPDKVEREQQVRDSSDVSEREDEDEDDDKEMQAQSKSALRAEKWQKFKTAYHDIFMAWFLFQPLFGSWQYGAVDANRSVRSCIWIAKFAVLLLLVFLYFGETNLNNYETERFEYEFLIRLIDGRLVLFLFGCYFITLALELLLLFIVYPGFWKNCCQPDKMKEKKDSEREKKENYKKPNTTSNHDEQGNTTKKNKSEENAEGVAGQGNKSTERNHNDAIDFLM
ncbi:uncharacterized protein LOC101461725 [Ceratitis capitata]|uniref:uncharacterized protein LOC101461725 n=1 Tax=Ceratitis capitata TaxID=7213 RepID=UPI0006188FE5|nr:uncharacterized protein LOC101461725 [Ceratitis capitata]XP_023158352.1 uncharacterized protein LOC101461725 [Ceratitis capitata]XP_023158353.1 uncharacterized protein LOC101461725 [Ceratitis capitata]XP_023158354.1 uncharacterized protein LOC101461725 [Ceratitis capitata]XP_023158355.1 uncharacterized protein LOC101461725 [Ceratitis capitata]